MDPEFCFNVWAWIIEDLLNHNLFWYTYLFLWILGILGNLANIVVYKHESMTKSYTISLFCCLAICDVIELVSLLVFAFFRNFSLISLLNSFGSLRGLMFCSVDLRAQEAFEIILLLSLNNMKILFNFLLVFVQYIMIAHPSQYKQLFSGKKSPKWMINGVFFFISVSVSCFLLMSTVYDSHPLEVIVGFKRDGGDYWYESHHGKYPEVVHSMFIDARNRKDDIFKEVISVNLTKSEDFRRTFMRKFGTLDIRRYNATTLVQWYIKNFPDAFERLKIQYVRYGSGHSILISRYMVVRIGLLIVLMMTSIGLIFRSQPRGPDSKFFYRIKERMKNMALMVALIFSIMELPIVAHSYFMLPVYIARLFTDFFDVNLLSVDSLPTDRCYFFSLIITIVMLLSSLLSCSYTPFCYSIMNAQYREIVNSVLYDVFQSLKNFLFIIQCTFCHRNPTLDKTSE